MAIAERAYVLVLGLLLAFASPAEAPSVLSDAGLIAADLVVVARADPSLLKCGEKATTASLVVAEALKGKAGTGRLLVRIRREVVADKSRFRDLRDLHKYLPGPDTGSEGADRSTPMYLCVWPGSAPWRVDITKDCIWFLTRARGGYEVFRARQVQSPKYQLYFAALLGENPHADLMKLLSHKDEDLKTRALRYLRDNCVRKDASRIATFTEDKSPKVQALAAEAAAWASDASALPTFRRALKHPNPAVREQACIFLCRFRDTGSLKAIGQAVKGLNQKQLRHVATYLGVMGSELAVPILLDFLDSDDTADGWALNCAAMESLRELTGAYFPPDPRFGWLRWQKLRTWPHEVRLRQSVVADIENLTAPEHSIRSAPRLADLTNRHLGDHGIIRHRSSLAQRPDGHLHRECQNYWRRWATGNLTRSRLDWIYDGFRHSGIELPRPMAKEGIYTLIQVLRYYEHWGDWQKGAEPGWSTDGCPGKARYHIHNANLLLEAYTGHTVGLRLSRDDRVWKRGVRAELIERWVRWWHENHDRFAVKPWPEERPVSREQLAEAPPLRPAPRPFELIIRPSRETFRRGDKPLMHLRIENASPEEVTIARRPSLLWFKSNARTGRSSLADYRGQDKEDFVTLLPGDTAEWTHSPPIRAPAGQAQVRNFQYVVSYHFTGKACGLQAWRGILYSNRLDLKIAD